jgi:hypothetical protein
MLEHFAPEDNNTDDSDFHKQARILSQGSADTEDDKDFTVKEIRKVVAIMGNKHAPREDGITGEIYKRTFEILSHYKITLYNGSIRRGVFSTRWKEAKIIKIISKSKQKNTVLTLICRIKYNITSTMYL